MGILSSFATAYPTTEKKNKMPRGPYSENAFGIHISGGDRRGGGRQPYFMVIEPETTVGQIKANLVAASKGPGSFLINNNNLNADTMVLTLNDKPLHPDYVQANWALTIVLIL